MKLQLLIAKRYLFSKKSKNIINLISIISSLVIAFVTAALILVMSVFNGVENLVLDLYNSLQPQLAIEHSNGIRFNPEEIYSHTNNVRGIHSSHKVLQGEVILQNKDKQEIATLVGIETPITSALNINQKLIHGSLNQTDLQGKNILLGAGLNYYLDLPAMDINSRGIELLSIPKGSSIKRQKQNALKRTWVQAKAVFSVNAEYDLNYCYGSYQMAANTLGENNLVNALYLSVDSTARIEQVQSDIAKRLPAKYKVISQNQMNNVILQTSQSEKLITFFILLFIVIIAAFNILASLTMLIFEKKEDLSTLQMLGFTKQKLIQVFYLQNILLCALGLGFGLLLGLGLAQGQATFQWVKLNGSVVEAYPILLKWEDVVLASIAIIIIALLAYFPIKWLVNRAIKTLDIR